jgi:hypothetical protein
VNVLRVFAVAASGEARALSHEGWLRLLGISPAVSAAVDLMTDDRVPMQTAVDMAMAAERDGKDPEAFARHFLKLRRVARGLNKENGS